MTTHGKGALSLGVSMMLVSAIVLMTETLLFHVLIYVSSYLNATLIISIALLGIAMGGIGGFYIRGKNKAGVLPYLAMATGMGILLCGVNCIFPQFLSFPILLICPFFTSSIIVAFLFIELKDHVAYTWNLFGAGLGVVAVSVLIPLINTENLMLAVFASCGVLACLLADYSRRPAVAMAGGIAILMMGVVSFAMNLGTGVFDFAKLTVCTHGLGEMHKVYCTLKDPENKLLYTRDNLVARVDIVDRKYIATYQEGVSSDIVEPRDKSTYEWDSRIPKGIVDKPRILVIGTSAEGVTKTSRLRSGGNMVGIEINPGVADLMQNELAEYSRNAYDGVDLHVMDARTYLEGTDEKFDLITMMNAHTRGRVGENAGMPQYLFTEEAFGLMFDHLTDKGALLIEEVVFNNTSALFTQRIFSSVISGLRKAGVTDHFERHFYAYDFRRAFFLFVVKKNPFTAEEAKALDSWIDKVRARLSEKKRQGFVKRIHPEKEMDNAFSRFVRDPEGITRAALQRGTDLSATTDDKPFLYDLDVRHSEAWRIFIVSLFLTTVLVLAPSLWLFRKSLRGNYATGLGGLGYFSLIGTAYMLVEIVLMQKYQLYLGSPVYSLIVVLGSLLIFSGIGSMCSKFCSNRVKQICILAIPLLLLLSSFGLGSFFEATQSFPMRARVALTMASLFPLFFCMGVPFPYGLTFVQNRLSAEYVPLVYGVNGGFGTLGATLSVLLSVYYGFAMTFYLGIILYFAAFGLTAVAAPNQTAAETEAGSGSTLAEGVVAAN